MAYDIHIEENRISESESYQFGIPESIHSYIFRSVELKKTKVPLFDRFSDYYSDAVFQAGDIDRLVEDLNGLIFVFNENKEVTGILLKLKNAATKAKELNGKLIGYCD